MGRTPAFLFAHGSSGGSSTPWMQGWTALLERFGPVHLFDYPFAAAGRTEFDPLEALIDAHQAAYARVRERWPDRPIVFAGKSLGSWVGCHLALRHRPAALISLGYPLCSPGAERPERGDVLLQLEVPLLLVQGTNDPVAPREMIAPFAATARGPREICWVDGGDHSLQVTVDQQGSDEWVSAAIGSFLDRVFREAHAEVAGG